MFVARIVGNSMDDGRSGLVNSRYAVFELWPTGSRQGLIVLARGSFSDPETGSYAVKKVHGGRTRARSQASAHRARLIEPGQVAIPRYRVGA